MQDKYLGFSGQKNMAIWLAINEKGVSLLNTALSVSGDLCVLCPVHLSPCSNYSYIPSESFHLVHLQWSSYLWRARGRLHVGCQFPAPANIVSLFAIATDRKDPAFHAKDESKCNVQDERFPWLDCLFLHRFAKQHTSWPATLIHKTDYTCNVFFLLPRFIFLLHLHFPNIIRFWLSNCFFFKPMQFLNLITQQEVFNTRCKNF